ncbi:phosphoglucomutase (femD) [Salinispira pacifica]|uniref:Phosphoglucomutase (FemD) n=1 Tax=Salinispira pacifica TaxID=1307761 RepID=V5WID9_9SPIO|nr:phosphoglucomutase (femD) [Salinispira pacifica]AHC15334.1 phosphoglucomutase (femD) [Salinispira pacifica]
MIDNRSGLTIGDSSIIPRRLQSASVSADDISRTLEPMILSASGWRKVFAASGDEEDQTEDISESDMVLAGLIGLSLGEYLLDKAGKSGKGTTVVVGCDSRPTGPLLADALMRVCSSLGIKIRYLFISAAPEVMSYARVTPQVDAFAYISASHNPIGHNGFKFGLKSGGVLPAADVEDLIHRFREHCKAEKSISRIQDMLASFPEERMNTFFRESADWKNQALEAYADFSTRVICDSSDENRISLRMEEMKAAFSKADIAVLGELNGSARTLSIDKAFFENLGVKMRLINHIPRQITHRIVPEGRSLNLCKEELEKAHSSDPAFILGYVPDNDGDRGNIVYMADDGRARILEAQQVFALVALAESAWLEYSGQLADTGARAAIAVNGPTSMRIDEIASVFGLECVRAEVGEANVVGLASRLREDGYIVRLMGEGSNGGNITHPAAVRDPLNSIGSIIKLLSLRGDGDSAGLFELWCKRRGIEYKADFSLEDVLSSLPEYVTTSAYEDRALMKITGTDHVRLKAAYEDIFLTDWEKRKDRLKDSWGIHSWEEINTEGSRETTGFGPSFRSGKHKGGLKILFRDSSGAPSACMWMRGSGTEPVYRVLVDVKGPRHVLEQELLEWHRDMIRRADSL